MSVLREGFYDGEALPVDSSRDQCHKNDTQSPSRNTYRIQNHRSIWIWFVYILHTIAESCAA